MQPPVQRPAGTSGRAVAVLVLGILGVTGFGLLTGLPAWILGNQALADIRRGILDAKDETLIQVGRILGVVTTVLTGCGLLLVIPFFVLPMFMMTKVMSDGDMGNVWKGYNQAEGKRKTVLTAAVAERKRHPSKTYQSLAKELNTAKGKTLAWFPGPVKPFDGCGEFSFSGENGMLTVKDTCGSTTLYGWPPKEGAPADEVTK